MFDIIIIGGGTAGMTAAIYGARAGKKCLLIEGNAFGGQIIYSSSVENYPGFSKISGAEFADKLFEQVSNLPVEIVYEEVVKVDVGSGVTIHTDSSEYEGKTLIIATGTKHRKLGLENEEALVGNGISYCALCDGPLYKNQEVCVVGSGNSAIQTAIFLSEYCKKVEMLVRGNVLKGEQNQIDLLNQKNNVSILYNTTVEKLLGDTELTGIIIKNENGETKKDLNGLFVSIGQVPDASYFKDIIEIDEYGYIVAGEDCKTNVPFIFAAGDCRTKNVRQLTTAVADGTIAVIGACKYLENKN